MTTAKKKATKPFKKAIVKPTTVTHGMETTARGKDDHIKRTVRVVRFKEGSFGMMMQTYWDGDDKPPMITEVHLSTVTFEVLTRALASFSMDMPRWTIPEEGKK